MVSAASLTWLDGTVAKRNDHGLVLDGESTWRNASKYAEPPVTIPEVGALVRVGCDKSGFIRCIEAVADAPQTAAPRTEVKENRPVNKDTAITRMACLKAATEFGIAAGVTVEDVLAIAEQFEGWVNR